MRTSPFTAASALVCVACSFAAVAATPAAFPSRPIRIIVGFPPGSGTDMLARFVGAQLAVGHAQPGGGDNRPGATGIIAGEITAKAPADGHTLQFLSTSHTMNAAVYTLPFDAVKSFTAITMLAAGPLVLVTHPSFPAKSVKEFVELAKRKPRGITYAVSGTGGINHFAGALFARLAGIALTDVPYRGGPQALTDLMAGEVQSMFATAAITHRQIKAGRLAALGVSTTKRTPLLPDVPTIAEAGVPGYAFSTWWGVVAPAGVPGAIAAKLDSEISAILHRPESQQRLATEGAEAVRMGNAEFARFLAAEVDKWRRVARDSQIKAE
jgi:tripartite-type tricarboxylate transporter receptor subunit TctC